MKFKAVTSVKLALAGLLAVAVGILLASLFTGCTAQSRADWIPFWKVVFGGAESVAGAAGQPWLSAIIHAIGQKVTEYPTTTATVATGVAGALAKHLHSGIPGTKRHAKHKAKKAAGVTPDPRATSEK